jgi:hypothetical protein
MKRLFGDDWNNWEDGDGDCLPNHVIENFSMSNVEVVSQNDFVMKVNVTKNLFCDNKIVEE